MLLSGLQNSRSATVVVIFITALVLMLNGINVHREKLLRERGLPLKEYIGMEHKALLKKMGEPLHCDTLPFGEAVKQKRYRRFMNREIAEDETVIIAYWPQENKQFIGSCTLLSDEIVKYVYSFPRKFYYRH